MSKFKFTCEQYGRTNVLEFQAVELSEVVEAFEQFLRGSGYHFDGSLDLCNITEPAPEGFSEGCVCESEQAIEQDIIKMPGTIGGAMLTFPDKRCNICGLTAEQLGSHTCYDSKCGMK